MLYHHELGFPGYSMLGFGDIILPGLFAAYTRRLDVDQRLPLVHGYFLPTCVGYGVGLTTTYLALMYSWFGDQGQPALMYLVPFTLGTVLGLAWLRGHLGYMWSSKKWSQEGHGMDHDSDSGGGGGGGGRALG